MCGITGYWSDKAPQTALAANMACRIESRGPDDAGVWVDDDVGLALAHRRLSILDLSPAGHQPMQSPCGRYVLTYNGEIYNHQDLRRELESQGAAFNWRSHSDTETLLAALRHWGAQATLEKLNGMFAFAFWDATQQILILARDRMGEKPLYYGNAGNTFLFGSELKALSVHPDWQGEVNRDVLALFMRHNYVPSPWSIYRNIYKLPPAHFTVIRENGRSIDKPICYWDLGQFAAQGSVIQIYDEVEVISEFDGLMRDAVSKQLASDVPLGAFLSGGYDSTMIVAHMQALSGQPVKTFTIGFQESDYNEAQYAKQVAAHLKTEHTELYVTPDEAMAVIPKLPEIYDEPFADSSQIPTYLVSKLARQHVSVSLSGDGGDELFFGYGRYTTCEAIWGKLASLPLPLRKLAGQMLTLMPGRAIEQLMHLLPKRFRIKHLADRLPKLAEYISTPDELCIYHKLISHWKNPDQLVLGANEPATIFDNDKFLSNLASVREKMMYLDMMTYLPDDILTKVDRASMAVGLEARVPLLDHRVVEFAWRVPTEYKYRDGKGKWLLRQVVHRYVPKELMERPKMGFGVPIEHWLRGPLREWGEALLDERRLKREGYFNPEPIRKLWEEHMNGTRRWHYYLWDVLMFQAWLEQVKV